MMYQALPCPIGKAYQLRRAVLSPVPRRRLSTQLNLEPLHVRHDSLAVCTRSCKSQSVIPPTVQHSVLSDPNASSVAAEL